MEIRHYPVMHKEVLEYLLIPPGKSCMIDCTTGEGGHTSLFLSNYPDLEVIGLDRDRDIQAKAIERLAPFGSRFHPVLSWFDDYLAQADADSADAVLFDLGISMFHYAESGRGFSFRNGERLDMRLDAETGRLAEIEALENDLYAAVKELEADVARATAFSGSPLAHFYRNTVIPQMAAVRSSCDALELIIGQKDWPYPTYGEMLFYV